MSCVESSKPLASLTTIGLGGTARYYQLVHELSELQETVARARSEGLTVWVLSGGSNILVSDTGLDGLVLDIRLAGISFERKSDDRVRVTVAAGEDWDAFVNEVARRGYSGVECLSGIPGRVGATPIQNVGAYGQDVSQTIESVDVLDRSTGEVTRLSAAECAFGYRTSRFKHGERDRYIVVSVDFMLSERPPALPAHRELQEHASLNEPISVQHLRDAVLSLRRAKSMVVDELDPCSRSCGSFFVNPVVSAAVAEAIQERYSSERVPAYAQSPDLAKIAAAWLIEKAGFQKGYRQGPVGISDKHSLAIVARAGATSRDVVNFARSIQRRVHEHFGIWLMPEPIFWGFETLERGLPRLD